VSVISDQMRAQIGLESKPYALHIEVEDVLRFAVMIEAGMPWLTDVVAARAGRYSGLVAAPTYLIVMRQLETRAIEALGIHIPFVNGVDGGSEWEYLEPVRPGDLITATTRLADYYERETSFGTTLFQVFEMVYRNQFDHVVVRQRDTRIFFS
jgi:acyl-CoA thioesterase FadM